MVYLIIYCLGYLYNNNNIASHSVPATWRYRDDTLYLADSVTRAITLLIKELSRCVATILYHAEGLYVSVTMEYKGSVATILYHAEGLYVM